MIDTRTLFDQILRIASEEAMRRETSISETLSNATDMVRDAAFKAKELSDELTLSDET